MNVRRRSGWMFGGVVAGLMGLAVLAGWGMGRHQAEPTRVAIVDMAKLLGGLDEGPAREAELNQRVQMWQAEVDELKREMENYEGDLAEANLTEGQRRDLQMKLYETRALAEAKFEARGQLIEALRGDIYRETYGKVLAAVEAIAEQYGYDLVVLDDRAEQIPPGVPGKSAIRIMQERTVLYASDALDITNLVVTHMNNEYAAGR